MPKQAIHPCTAESLDVSAKRGSRRTLLRASFLLAPARIAPMVWLVSGCHQTRPLPPLPGETLPGRIDSVQDGDSLTLSEGGRRIAVRIAGIDAPERGQPYADASRDHLIALLASGEHRIAAFKTDPFGRRVARVWVRDQDLGLRQIQAGLAWHFVRYQADQTPQERQDYAQAQRQAREARRGLWQQAQPVAPWEHRQQQRG